MMTPTMIKDYENAHGAKAAYDLLTLIGPDGFDGDYSTTLICLAQIETDERDLQTARWFLNNDEECDRGVWGYFAGEHLGRMAKCRAMID